VGRPLASEEEIGERLSKKKALAIFSSDAISSSAYATEEILRVLVLAGASALAFGLEVSIAIALLLTVVAISYRQVCQAYPSGGGSYAVSRANFGRLPSLVAASALLIDYVMTVAVSTSSAVEQITSAVPELIDERVLIGVVAIALITLGNLRGLRESGNIFAAPTYLFVGSALLMSAIGAFRIVVLGEGGSYTATLASTGHQAAESFGVLILLRAFASGSVALTGTEAIATGVQAFKPPRSEECVCDARDHGGAARGPVHRHLVPCRELRDRTGRPAGDEDRHRPGRHPRVGDGTIPLFLFQAFTALLLFLAANTSFAAFPRLAAILAEDGFMPRQFSFRGDRLAFSWGIVVLGVVAATLVAAFRGETHLLIPLYAIGVFIDFTISQSGMVKHWLTTREPGFRRRLAINLTGCVLTFTVGIIVTLAKAPQSLLVLVLIPVLVSLMLFIRRQYDAHERELYVREDQQIAGPHREQRVVIPVNGINRAVVQAVNFGRTLAKDVRAVFVTDDTDDADALRKRWERQLPGVPLVIVESPYRVLIEPVVAYLDILKANVPENQQPVTIVVLPEYVARHWWERLLYNQSARRLKAALVGREHTVIADVPYRRER
jgi:amino acid transporter